MYEVNIKSEFLGLPKCTVTQGQIFRRFGRRNWERFDAAFNEHRGQWQKIRDENIIDALEVGYAYGREYLKWQIGNCMTE